MGSEGSETVGLFITELVHATATSDRRRGFGRVMISFTFGGYPPAFLGGWIGPNIGTGLGLRESGTGRRTYADDCLGVLHGVTDNASSLSCSLLVRPLLPSLYSRPPILIPAA